MTPHTRCLIRRFPGAAEKIEQFYAGNEDFRELSHDYCLCVSSLERCEEDPETNRELIDEYRALLKELEEEAAQFLKEGSIAPHET